MLYHLPSVIFAQPQGLPYTGPEKVEDPPLEGLPAYIWRDDLIAVA